VFPVHKDFEDISVKKPDGRVVMVELTESLVKFADKKRLRGGGGGGGNGEPQYPRLQGNSQPRPPEVGNITRQTTDPHASVIEMTSVDTIVAFDETIVG
jgi:hypothetical protein